MINWFKENSISVRPIKLEDFQCNFKTFFDKYSNLYQR